MREQITALLQHVSNELAEWKSSESMDTGNALEIILEFQRVLSTAFVQAQLLDDRERGLRAERDQEAAVTRTDGLPMFAPADWMGAR